MNVANLEQKLERLLDSTRRGTEPDPEARERVRAALGVRIAGTAPAPTVRRRLNKGYTLLAVSGGILLSVAAFRYGVHSRAPQRRDAAHAASEAAPTRAASAPSFVANGNASAKPVDATRPLPPLAAMSRTAAAPTPAVGNRLAPRSRAAPLAEVGPVEQTSEVALMSALQLALRRGDAQSALALADQHQRRFPHGALSMEREAGRAVARCSTLEGEKRAAVVAEFSRRFPASPLLSRVEDACSH